jgi:hypothetical protein
MSVQDQSRALMVRHHQMIKNRQQSMLSRTAAALGIPAEVANLSNHTRGEDYPNSGSGYDRSNVGLS